MDCRADLDAVEKRNISASVGNRIPTLPGRVDHSLDTAETELPRLLHDISKYRSKFRDSQYRTSERKPSAGSGHGTLTSRARQSVAPSHLSAQLGALSLRGPTHKQPLRDTACELGAPRENHLCTVQHEVVLASGASLRNGGKPRMGLC